MQSCCFFVLAEIILHTFSILLRNFRFLYLTPETAQSSVRGALRSITAEYFMCHCMKDVFSSMSCFSDSPDVRRSLFDKWHLASQQKTGNEPRHFNLIQLNKNTAENTDHRGNNKQGIINYYFLQEHRQIDQISGPHWWLSYPD